MEYRISIGIVIVLLAGCIFASYTDIKYGKVSNRLIFLLGFTLGLSNILQIIYFKSNAELYIRNMGIVVIFALILYGLKVWAGGDTKLMIMISIATPPIFYTDSGLFYTLIFAFLLGFVYLIVDSIILFFRRKSYVCYSKIETELKCVFIRYIKVIMYIAAIRYIFNYLSVFGIRISADLFIAITIVFFVIYNKVAILEKNAIVGIIIGFNIFSAVMLKTVTINTTWYAYLFIFASMFVRVILNQFNYSEINTNDVKKGMILSRVTSIKMQKSNVKGLPGISDESLASRLNLQQAESIKRWGKSAYGTESITVVKRIPFAVFITMGWAICLLLGCEFN